MKNKGMSSILLILLLLLTPPSSSEQGLPPQVESFTVTPHEVYNDGEGNVTFILRPAGSENITTVRLNLTPLGGEVVEMDWREGEYVFTYVVPQGHPPGEYNVTAVVVDNESERTEVSALVRVLQYNRPPQLSPEFNGTIVMEEDSPPRRLNLSEMFFDPDEDPLSFALVYGSEASSSISTSLVNLKINGSDLVITPLKDANGLLNFTVRAFDGEYTTDARINLTISPRNDPPVVSINTHLLPTQVDLGDSIVLIADADDPDADPLNFTWTSSLQGILGYGAMIRATLNVPGTHNITVTVSDGMVNSSASVVIQVLFQEENETFTEEELRRNYTDPKGDEIWWELDTSFYYTYHKNSKPGYDILSVVSEKEDGNIVIIITTTGNVVNSSAFEVYFVKKYFKEENFDKGFPMAPRPTAEDGLIFSTSDVFSTVKVEGNRVFYRIPLSVLEEHGIDGGGGFEIFVIAYAMYDRKDIVEGAILDTAGFGAIEHTVEEGERVKSPLGDVFKWAMVICGVGIIIVVLIIGVVIYFLVKRKKGGETPPGRWPPPPPPPETGQPPEYPPTYTGWEKSVWEGSREKAEGSSPTGENEKSEPGSAAVNP